MTQIPTTSSDEVSYTIKQNSDKDFFVQMLSIGFPLLTVTVQPVSLGLLPVIFEFDNSSRCLCCAGSLKGDVGRWGTFIGRLI